MMGFMKVESLNDERLEKDLVHHFEEVKRHAKRMNEVGAEMVNRDIIKGYEKMYYPNIWNHGQREVTT